MSGNSNIKHTWEIRFHQIAGKIWVLPISRLEGGCHTDFSLVEETFRENFADRGEIGAAVCVYKDGEKVVDLWGGHRDESRTRPWTEDTITLMSSIAKSMAALSIHILVDRGQVSLDEPVARYWPEFARNGKENILLRHTISHQCGVIFSDAAKPGDFFNYPAQVAAIAAQEPAWPAGSQGAYNSINFGFIHGEIVRRVSGKRLRDFIREEITGPLGADYNVGLNKEELARVAPMHPNPENKFWEMGAKPGTLLNRAWRSQPAGVDLLNCRENREGENLSSGGHGKCARHRSRVRDAGQQWRNGRRPPAQARNGGTTFQTPVGGHLRYDRLGLANGPRIHAQHPAQNTDGKQHEGLRVTPAPGGALTFCDREKNMAFGFCTNYQPEGMPPGIRPRSLVAAAFGKAPDWKPETPAEI